MAELLINVPVPEEFAEFYEDKGLIILPLSDLETDQFAAALHGIETFLRSFGEDATHAQKLALGQIVFIRTMLGRSIPVKRLSPQDEKRKIQ